MAHILVIDDDEDVRDIIVKGLTREGHQILSAANGRAAAPVLDSGQLDLVITDIVMPERDGIEIIMSLQEKGRVIPVVAITGAADNTPLYLKVAKGLGAVRILAKPFEMEQLVKTVNEV